MCTCTFLCIKFSGINVNAKLVCCCYSTSCLCMGNYELELFLLNLILLYIISP